MTDKQIKYYLNYYANLLELGAGDFKIMDITVPLWIEMLRRAKERIENLEQIEDEYKEINKALIEKIKRLER